MVRRRIVGATAANDGSLETSASLAGHASTKTTQLYNRTAERIEQEEIERIRF